MVLHRITYYVGLMLINLTLENIDDLNKFGQKIHFRFNNEIVTAYFRFFKRSLNILRTIWRPS